jgi:hypothetical protein
LGKKRDRLYHRCPVSNQATTKRELDDAELCGMISKMGRRKLGSAMSLAEFRRLRAYELSQKKARLFGTCASKPDWSFAPKEFVQIQATGRMEMNKSRHWNYYMDNFVPTFAMFGNAPVGEYAKHRKTGDIFRVISYDAKEINLALPAGDILSFPRHEFGPITGNENVEFLVSRSA